MSDLRAPDPTLDNYIDDVGLDFREAVTTAHRLDHHGCDAEVDHPLPGPVYAYTAVPCRDCFPDAPPRGHGPDVWPGSDRVVWWAGLAWQVQPWLPRRRL